MVLLGRWQPWHNAVLWHCCYVREAEGAAQQSRYFMFCSLPFNLMGKFSDRSKFPLCCTTHQFTSRVWRGERLFVHKNLFKSATLPLFLNKTTPNTTPWTYRCVEMLTQNIHFSNKNTWSYLGEFILTGFSWLNAEGISWKEGNKVAERPGGFDEAAAWPGR